MVEDRIGHRYAKSAFDLAEEKNIVDDARSDMALILDIYNQNKDFADFLAVPIENDAGDFQIVDLAQVERLREFPARFGVEEHDPQSRDGERHAEDEEREEQFYEPTRPTARFAAVGVTRISTGRPGIL